MKERSRQTTHTQNKTRRQDDKMGNKTKRRIHKTRQEGKMGNKTKRHIQKTRQEDALRDRGSPPSTRGANGDRMVSLEPSTEKDKEGTVSETGWDGCKCLVF
jgi:hypothetical protein